MAFYGGWAYKIEEAARQGAAGVLIVHDGDAAGYGWSLVQSTWTGAQLGLSKADGGAGRAAIEGWIQKEAARALFTAAGLDFTATAAAAGPAGVNALPVGLPAGVTHHN